jgi:hypothetical protein
MVQKLASALIALLALAGSTSAKAASAVPDKVGAFVSYCATHFADCKSEVVATDVAAMASILFAKKGAPACVVPKGVKLDTGTKDILAWLGVHKGSYAMKTGDGIRAAEKALWNCQAQIGDGSEPGGPPAKTGPFVTYCKTHHVDCANEMVAVSVSLMATEHSKHCQAPDRVETEEMTVATLGWLGQHKETYALATEDGIMAAFDNLWPCH